ncbi:DUF6538 domain-containing protein [Primorskyibacter sp. 2E233]|uniref:DUF6538 domain-containing protein n=1 Tax=Primorskyibacter sp. 2E233 TaxID=3413431 RepID=UPI003BF055B3
MTVLRMTNPVLRNGVYWLRVAVPRPLREAAKGRSIALSVGELAKTLKVGERVTTSLHTSDKAEARQRAAQVLEQAETFFATLRGQRPALTHKQVIAFAGQMMQEVIAEHDDDPGRPDVWKDVLAIETRLGAGSVESWSLDATGTPRQLTREEALMARYAPAIARVESRHAVYLTDDDKARLVDAAHREMVDAAKVNLRKAEGDYSDGGHRDRHPKLERPSAREKVHQKKEPLGHWSFAEVINREEARRSKGADAKPLSDAALRKYRLHCGRFAAFRGSDDVRTVTPREAQDWLDALADDPKLKVSNRVRGEHLNSVRAVIGYAIAESLGEIFPNGNPLAVVKKPAFKPKPKGSAALTFEEARTILLAARKDTRPHIRWMPWLMAYSGARVGEVGALAKDSFAELDGRWFYHIRGSAKTTDSIRIVPVHPALVEEGLMDFAKASGPGPLFTKSCKAVLLRWIREDLKLTRKELAPNHGWRHLFADFSRVWMNNDSMVRALAGRADPGSMSLYGGSQALWAGLWDHMARVPAIPLDVRTVDDSGKPSEVP